MTTAPGETLSHYRIIEKIGEGGMGVVYEALDSTLNRHVALKVLPEAFLNDPERVARFDREAKLLAALNHPHIAGIYGFEEARGVRFLVLELVSGETLAERLARGSFAIEEALTVCRQIAEGLEAAHEKGIIHRDLKPGNVKLTLEGKVKVLDFGLAKAFGDDYSGSDLSRSPTMTAQATLKGVVLGTAAYMSPEQARGKPLDRRTDIWSFGCVLYEALTGRQAFAGETVSDTLAAILTRDPDWQVIPANLPVTIRRLLQRCLHKDASRRLRDIGEARLEMEEALAGSRTSATGLPLRATSGGGELPLPSAEHRSIPFTVAGVLVLSVALLAGGGVWMATRTAPPAQPPIVRFAMAAAEKEPLALAERPAVALSPDGTRAVYVTTSQGDTRLNLRSLDRLEAVPIPGTEGGTSPFFSPDGEWVGFFAEGRLKKVPLRGGPPVNLCDAAQSRGGTWGPDDTILFAPRFVSGLSRVSAAGGTPQVFTTPDSKAGERTHRWPEILPGGKAVLLTIGSLSNPDYYLDSKIAVQSLETGTRKVLVEGGTNAHYASSGHLVYAGVGGLFAAPFDLKRLEVTGPPVPILEGVTVDTTTGAAQFALSGNGSLLYAPGDARAPDRNLVWVDRKGAPERLPAPPHPYREPRLSPDGSRMALTISGTRNDDIWVYDIARGALSRLTFQGSSSSPVWTPDGKRIVYQSTREDTIGLYWTAADGSGSEERLVSGTTVQIPDSWTPDGKILFFRQIETNTGDDVLMLPLEGERKPRPFLQTPFDEGSVRFSPDGHWIAYVSNLSGRPEVYVQAFPGPGGKWQISTEGGGFPVWAGNGREIFYSHEDSVMSVAITTEPTFAVSAPRLLFQRHFVRGGITGTAYDVTPDGQRFILVEAGDQEQAATQMTLVLNWLQELTGRVLTGTK